MDEAITMFVSRMVPNGTWINTDSLIKGVESYILCQPTGTQTSPTCSYHQRTDGSGSPSTVTVVHRLGEPMDGISSDEHSELERLRRENREKTKCIKELEAREHRFQQIDKLVTVLRGTV